MTPEFTHHLLYACRLGRSLHHVPGGERLRRNAMKLLANRNCNPQKVLCIGWLKTGTTSFGSAMRKLGFWHYTFDPEIYREWYQKRNDIKQCLEFAAHFDSFDDLPWNALDTIDAFAERFPESKYVLLERDADDWHDSLTRFRRRRGQISDTDAAIEISDYRHRVELLKRKFEKTGSLLVMNLFKGDGYEQLCPFLGVPVIDAPFPYTNINTRYVRKKD